MLLFGWAIALSLVAVSVTQWIGFDRWRPVAVVQSLSFHALPCATPVVVVAAVAGRWSLAAVGSLSLLTWAWLVAPAITARRPTASPDDGARVSVFFGNLLSENPKVPEVMDAVAACKADVLVLTEFTPDMRNALVERCGDRYPHRIEDVRPNPAGIAVWSTRPLFGSTVPLSDRPGIDATVDIGGGTPLRMLGLHTEPPTMRARVWSRELGDIGEMAVDLDMVIGDFNAARWHPSFRRLLARGWTTAHEWHGLWWRNSWAQEGRAFPMFVRIDHALLRDHVRPTSVQEVPLPGSDHRGFVVSLSVSPPAS